MSPTINNASTTTFLPDDAWIGIVRSLRLSQREAEIALLLLAEDNRDEAMAAKLAISPHTVHTYMERLYRKLRVTSRSQVVARMFERYVALTADRGPFSPERHTVASHSFSRRVTSRASRPHPGN